MRTRIIIAITTIAFSIAILVFTSILTSPVAAAPPAQGTLPDFNLNAQTVITLTVALSTGQVIVVPVDVTLIARNQDGTTSISVIPQVEQQLGMFVGVENSRTPSTSLRVGQGGAIAPAATPNATTPSATAGETGTHTVNNNANLRSGPGTDNDIVGRAAAGTNVVIVGQNEDGSWLQLEDGSWIAAFLVTPVEESAIEENADESAVQATPATYLSDVTSIGASIIGAMSALENLLLNEQPTDPQWPSQVADQLSIISGALDQYLALTPVAGYEEVHTQVANVAITCEQAADYATGGLGDPQSISPTLAVDLIQSCVIQATDLATYAQTLQ
jgi:hypothetical protein